MFPSELSTAGASGVEGRALFLLFSWISRSCSFDMAVSREGREAFVQGRTGLWDFADKAGTATLARLNQPALGVVILPAGQR